MLASLLVLAACGSDGGGAPSASPTTAVSTDARHHPKVGGQYSVAEARQLPELAGADARALRSLTRGTEPTAPEVTAAMDGMSSLAGNPEPAAVTAEAREALEQAQARARSAVTRWPTAGRLGAPASAWARGSSPASVPISSTGRG